LDLRSATPVLYRAFRGLKDRLQQTDNFVDSRLAAHIPFPHVYIWSNFG